MDWDVIERHWKPFKRKLGRLLNALTDMHLGALVARRIAGLTDHRVGSLANHLNNNSARHGAQSVTNGETRSGDAPTATVLAAPTVLFVEREPGVSGLLQAGLADRFHVERVTRLSDALKRLVKGGVEVVILELTLPDARGLEVFDRVIAAEPNALVFILIPPGDEELARQAMQRGAHDYFLKDQIDSHWLSRTLQYVFSIKVTREALLSSEARFRAISDASPLGIFVSDAQGNCIYTNTAYQRISGLNFEQTMGTRWSKAIHPEDRQRVINDWHAAALSNSPFQAEYRFQRQDGSVVWTRVNSSAMDDGVSLHGYVQTVEDITERKMTEFGLKKAEEALFEEKERAQVTLNSIGDAVLSTNTSGNVTYLNKVAETMTGWTSEEALGRPFTEVFRIIDGKTREVAVNPAQRALDEDRTVGLSADCVLIRRDGTESAIEDSAAPIHDRHGNVSGAVIVFHDVSQSRAMASKLAHQATHDFLTGLPNRAQLTERLAQAIGMARRHEKQVALLFLDLDDFKSINDSLGHAIGDRLLQSVAERLLSSVRSTDMVCRYGGDEFVILLDEIEYPQRAELVAQSLIRAFAEPQIINAQEVDVSLSIGISVYPEDGTHADTLIRNADTAMFHAKSDGRSIYHFYSTDMNIQATHRLAVQSRLRRALKDDELTLHYQPQINLVSGSMTGAEALIRWQDPELGLIYPGNFVAIAEECGLIVTIGRWALREACKQVRAWQVAGLGVVPVTVNVSAVEFRHTGFIQGVAQILQETGLSPDLLELELTETVLMHDTQSSTTVLNALKALGVGLAIDDFGTGCSSLSYLKRFPIDTLKIDQSFVRDIGTDTNGADDGTIVSAVIGLGKNLNQRVIAEGVETPEQLAFLRNQECEEGQGFHFSHAVPAKAFGALLESRQRW